MAEQQKELSKEDLDEYQKIFYGIEDPTSDLVVDAIREVIKRQPIVYDNNKNWMVWDLRDRYWKQADDIDISNAVSNYVEKIYPKVTLLVSVPRLKSMYFELIKKESRMMYNKWLEEYNQPEMIKRNIRLKDWVFMLDEQILEKPIKEEFLVNRVPYNMSFYEHEISMPKLDSLLKEWVGEDNILLAKEIIAYCMLADYPIHRFFVLNGSGRNGKGSFLRLIERVLGKNNCTSVNFSGLQEGRFDASKLYRKLVATISETDYGIIYNMEKIKALTGGDSTSIEFKHKNAFDSTNYAKIIIATNSLPETNDKSIAFYERCIILDFPNTYLGDEVVLDIEQTIPDTEIQCLIRQLLTSVLPNLLESKKFDKEGTWEEKKVKYDARSMPLIKFIDLSYEKDINSFIELNKIAEKFNKYCKDKKIRLYTPKELSKKLTNMGYDKQQKPITVFYGLKELKENT